MAFLSSLTDNFATSGTPDVSLWTFSNLGLSGTATNAGGELILSADTTVAYNGECHLKSNIGYELASSGMYVRLSSLTSWPSTSAGTTTAFIIEGVSDPANEYLSFSISSDQTALVLASTPGAGLFYGGVFTYDTTNWAWLRIRESAGTLYWDTAPSSASNPPSSGDWVNRGSTATSNLTWASGTTVKAHLSFRLEATAGTPPNCKWDGLNSAAAASTSTYNDACVETMTFTQTAGSGVDYTALRTEAATLTSTVTSGSAQFANLTETASLTETSATNFAQSAEITELFTLTDTLSSERAYFGAVTETAALTDTSSGAQFWASINNEAATVWTPISD